MGGFSILPCKVFIHRRGDKRYDLSLISKRKEEDELQVLDKNIHFAEGG